MHFMPRVIDARSLEFLISVGMLGYRGRIGFAMGFPLGVAENIMILTIFKPSNVLYKFLKERNECSDLELATVGKAKSNSTGESNFMEVDC